MSLEIYIDQDIGGKRISLIGNVKISGEKISKTIEVNEDAAMTMQCYLTHLKELLLDSKHEAFHSNYSLVGDGQIDMVYNKKSKETRVSMINCSKSIIDDIEVIGAFGI
ncbi:MAG: hypothetical protein AABW50_02195 [Nanoarchaeota archaeon]